ncbi:MAG: sigma-70 family RNA polymerase sigma factor [Acidobacteriota bacterium]|nr:sigma-70 family RNA polymerase sigma factor [Acidobacteriota bacterium]
MNDTLPEQELLRLAVAGEEAAFAALYMRLKSSVYRFALHMTGSPAQAEDIVQDAFLTLVQEGDRYDESKGQVLSFLLGITRNLVRRVYRSSLREAPLTMENEEGEEVEMVLESGHDTIAEVLQGEAVSVVRDAVQSLPPHYREVVVLCDLCDMTYAEASKQLDCNLGTIRSRLNRAHNLLAKKLESYAQPSRRPAGGMIQGCLL